MPRGVLVVGGGEQVAPSEFFRGGGQSFLGARGRIHQSRLVRSSPWFRLRARASSMACCGSLFPRFWLPSNTTDVQGERCFGRMDHHQGSLEVSRLPRVSRVSLVAASCSLLRRTTSNDLLPSALLLLVCCAWCCCFCVDCSSLNPPCVSEAQSHQLCVVC